MTDLTALRELLARAVELEEKAVEAAELDEIAAIEAAAADEPAGWDPLEAKGWAPCPECGSTNVDEYADGTARCEDCGYPLAQGKAFDFDDDGLEDVVGFDEKALAGEELAESVDLGWGDVDDSEPETKGDDVMETLSEIELLIARRNELTA